MIKIKRIAFCIATIILGSTAWAQQDSLSQAVVANYLRLLNYDNLPNKTVYLESSIIENNFPDDTMYMKRWYCGNNFSRIELYHQGKQIIGYCSNGKKYWHYKPGLGRWDTLSMTLYYDSIVGYDYRKPIHTWQSRNLELKKCDIINMEGQEVYRVEVSDPDHLDRYYMFEKSSGLLFLMMPVVPETGKRHQEVEWRAINEYLPIDGAYIFPSVESYQNFNAITIYYTETELLPFDKNTFEIK